MKPQNNDLEICSKISKELMLQENSIHCEIILEKYLAPGINQRDKMHWSTRAKTKKMIALMVLSIMKPSDRQFLQLNKALKEPKMVHIHYIRYSNPPMDSDNLHGSFKSIGDALKSLGLIKDDAPKYISLRCSQVVTIHKQTKLTISV